MSSANTAGTHDDVPDHLKPRPEKASGPKAWWSITKEALGDFSQDGAMTQAAAVAFYTALSFAPLLMLTVFFFAQLDSLFGTGTQERVISEIRTLIGGEAAGVVEEVQTQQATEKLSLWSFSGIISIAVLIWSASGVFAQLQAAMNTIWDVEPAPGQGIWGYVRTRLLSVGMVFSILFLLLVSLVITALISAIFSNGGMLWQVINFLVSLAVYLALFAAMFRYVPDVDIPWKAAAFGAVVTAVLFAIGKWGIGLYLGKSDPGSAYGGAGSVIVLLIWVYYSAIIVFIGAEFTQVWAKQQGFRIKPSEHARPEQPKAKKRPANDGAADAQAKRTT